MTASYKPALSVARAARVHRQAGKSSTSPSEHPLLRLQRRAGNAAVARLVEQSGTIARQETLEEEELAQASHDATLQREEGLEEEELAQASHDATLQREEGLEEEELAQADHDDDRSQGQVGLEGGPLPDAASRQVESMRGAGSGLDGGIRSTMESALGVDLSSVRVHQGSSSDALARTMTARAFTTGADVFLRGDVSASDPHLMAHELTHVVQQSGAPAAGVQGQRMSVGAADDPLEREADRVADAVTSGNIPEPQDS